MEGEVGLCELERIFEDSLFEVKNLESYRCFKSCYIVREAMKECSKVLSPRGLQGARGQHDTELWKSRAALSRFKLCSTAMGNEADIKRVQQCL